MTAYGYHFCTMRLFNLFVFGLLVICSLSGCCEATANPDVPTGMLSKSRDYLFFCLQIIQGSRPLYNQFASRYYYALFSIAKISSIWKHKHFNNEFETYEEGIYLHGICSKDTIEVWLDGEYVYMSDVPDFGIYFELTPGEHKMVFELYDRCGNKTTEEIVLQRYVN